METFGGLLIIAGLLGAADTKDNERRWFCLALIVVGLGAMWIGQ